MEKSGMRIHTDEPAMLRRESSKKLPVRLQPLRPVQPGSPIDLDISVNINFKINGNALTSTLPLSTPSSRASSIADLWTEQISHAIKQAVTKAHDSPPRLGNSTGFKGRHSIARAVDASFIETEDFRNDKDYFDYLKHTDRYSSLSIKPDGHLLKAPEERSLNALVVDDSAICRNACGAMLEELGYRVSYSSTGREAIDRIFRGCSDTRGVNSYDVLLIADSMAIMDGTDTVRALRLNGYAGTIVGLTYNMLDRPSKHFRNSGCATLLQKPVRFQLLKNTLSKLEIENRHHTSTPSAVARDMVIKPTL